MTASLTGPRIQLWMHVFVSQHPETWPFASNLLAVFCNAFCHAFISVWLGVIHCCNLLCPFLFHKYVKQGLSPFWCIYDSHFVSRFKTCSVFVLEICTLPGLDMLTSSGTCSKHWIIYLCETGLHEDSFHFCITSSFVRLLLWIFFYNNDEFTVIASFIHW